jgi:hypothetical protein
MEIEEIIKRECSSRECNGQIRHFEYSGRNGVFQAKLVYECTVCGKYIEIPVKQTETDEPARIRT